MKIFGRPAPEGYRYTEKHKMHESYRTIIHLHKIERRLRAEIEREQVTHWTPAQIKARFG